jgi:hypothetical protein
MTAATYGVTNVTTEEPTTWFAQQDANSAVLQRVGDNFAPRAATTPAMSVVVDPGFLSWRRPDGTEYGVEQTSAQTVAIAAAPGAPNNRWDTIYVNAGTGVAGVVTGTPATTPTPPGIPAGCLQVGFVYIPYGTTVIASTNLEDTRRVWAAGTVALPWALAGGTATAITAAYNPANPVLYDGMLLSFRQNSANTGAATFDPDGLGAVSIFKSGGSPLVAGDIPAGSECIVRYNAGYPAWELLNPAQAEFVLTETEIVAALGWTPVEAGGGIGQSGGHNIYIGWSGTALLCTVDTSNLGTFAFQSWVSANFQPLSSAVVTTATNITLTAAQANALVRITGTSALTVSLPAAGSCAGGEFTLLNVNGNTNVSLSSGGGSIEFYWDSTDAGAPAWTTTSLLAWLSNYWGKITLRSDGANWYASVLVGQGVNSGTGSGGGDGGDGPGP